MCTRLEGDSGRARRSAAGQKAAEQCQLALVNGMEQARDQKPFQAAGNPALDGDGRGDGDSRLPGGSTGVYDERGDNALGTEIGLYHNAAGMRFRDLGATGLGASED